MALNKATFFFAATQQSQAAAQRPLFVGAYRIFFSLR